MNRTLILSVLCAVWVGAHLMAAETPESANTPNKDAPAAATSDDLQRLRNQIAEQAEQIKRLQQAVESQQKLIEETMRNSPSAATKTTANADQPVKLVPAVNIVNSRHGGQAQAESKKPSPLSISIGNTTFTPLGFMDMTYFTRTTNVGSGIGTNFGGIPNNTTAAGHLSETNFTAQNSRIGFRVDSTVLGAKVLGYLETDFLFNNDSNSYQITSNSAALRLRNYFVDIEKNGFEVLGGQDWSLLTPNRKGLSPLPSDIFYTQNMDTNYQVGLVWTRAPQFRFIAHPNENVAFGVALENPQQYIGGGAGEGTVTYPSALNTALTPQFQSGASPTGAPNLFPDIIFKGAFDGKAGDRAMHFEAAGLVRGYKNYLIGVKPPTISGPNSAVGYGGAVNSNFELFKGFHLIENAYFSDGGGRYIFGQAPDLIVRPDGSISPVHSFSTLDGFEAQVAKNSLLALYYGGIYVDRNVAFDPTAPGSSLKKPVYVGYGFQGSAYSNNRYVQELTFDWVQTLWKNPSYGALSLINQYSYLWREPWYVATPGPKQAHTNLIYINLRYTLP
jgi:hypothetical protein